MNSDMHSIKNYISSIYNIQARKHFKLDNLKWVFDSRVCSIGEDGHFVGFVIDTFDGIAKVEGMPIIDGES